MDQKGIKNHGRPQLFWKGGGGGGCQDRARGAI